MRLVSLSILFFTLNLFGQDTTGVGSIAGVVVGPENKPVARVKVCLSGAARCTDTDSAGAFQLVDLRAASYRLELAVAGQEAVPAAEIEVRAGLESKIEIVLPRLDGVQQSITVSAPAYVAQEEVKNSGYLVTDQEVYKSAGALQDISRYLQTLPGVAIGSDDFRNDIIVRGGSPLENLFVVDNIEIPNINSFANFASAGGSVSILDAALIQDSTFLTGGYPASFVNRASSVLQVAQREGNRDNVSGRATLGFAGAGGILEGPIKKGKGSWLVSARRSFLDALTDDTGIGGVPVVYTFTAKGLYDLTPRDRVWAVSITGVDKIRLGYRDKEGAENDDELNNFDIRYQGWRSANGFNWQHLFGDRSVGLLGFTHSEASVTQTVRDLLRTGVFLPRDQATAVNAIYSEDSREGETTLKYDFTTYAGLPGKMQAGGNFKIFRLNYVVDSPYGNDTPYSAIRDLNPFALRQRFHAYQTGSYFQSTANVTRRMNLTWGGRLDHYSYIDRTRFSPRAGISYRITGRLSWRASFGSYYQQPFFLFLSAFPESRGAVPFRSDHYVTGLSYQAGSTLRFTVEAYRKNYKDYPVSLQFPQVSLANIGDTFDVQDILFPLTSAGRGRVQGIEFFMEKKFSEKWFGQFNVSFSKTRHAGLDGLFRNGSFDYPRVVNAVGGYRFSRKYELSSRVSWLSGRPYTPFDTQLSTSQGRGIFKLDQVNGMRLPDYVRWDIRLDRTFIVNDKALLVFVGAQNVLNRENIAGYNWNRRFNRQETNTQLGIFPLVGFDWRF